MSIREQLLEAYEAVKRENEHGDLQRDLRGLIKRNYPQMDVNPIILSIDKKVSGATRVIEERQRNSKSLDVDKLFNTHYKKKMKKAGKKVVTTPNAIVAVNTIEKEVVKPDVEVLPKTNLEDSLLKETYKKYLSLSDEDLISTFGSLTGARNYANEVLGLGLNKNSRKDKTVAAIKIELSTRLGVSVKDEEE